MYIPVALAQTNLFIYTLTSLFEPMGIAYTFYTSNNIV